MKFRTEINIEFSYKSISYEDKIMLLGSCFSENIGELFSINKFNVNINPFGIAYNPLSICKSISFLIDNKSFSEKDLFFDNGLWKSFSHHGSFSDASKLICLEKINQRIRQGSEHLQKASFLIITLGTAWVYELKTTKEIVNNCHKLSEKTFNRRRLSVKEIENCFNDLIPTLKQINPNLELIFTVSPIRHWKDGAHENQLSKSCLLLAIEELQKKFNFIHYFPAYEIVMDELRDYRFYAEDMLHPNKIAIDYIWEKFTETYFSGETKKTRKEIEHIIKAQSHRPFNPDTKEHQYFLKKIEEKKTELKEKYPFIEL
jgi:hypothetical protein